MRTRSIVAGACLVLAVASCAGERSGPTPSPSAPPSSQVTSAFPAFDQTEALSVSEPVRFRGAGGVRLEGRVFGSGDVGVVLGHMWPGDQSQWLGFAALSPTEGTWS